MVGCLGVYTLLIFPLPWYCERIQEFIFSYALNQSSQISCGGSSCSPIREVIGSQLLTKKQSRILQYLLSDVGAPNPREFLFH